MTDALDMAMRNAGINLLAADTSLTVISNAVPPGQEPPYIRVYSTVEWPDSDPNNALDGLSSRAVVRWYCHCVGASDEAAIAVAQRVRTQLLNQRPTINGMVPGLIRHEQDAPPVPDESTGVMLIDNLHVYKLTVDS